MELTPEQGRVLGCLVEKQLTTPQQYPLTDNALIAACNQTTSRDPVVAYDTTTVRVAVRSLREAGLLRTVHRPGERSDKHQHQLDTALGLTPEQAAVLAVLVLRGPQTPAELRVRTERMHPFDNTEQLEDVLLTLANRPEPLVARLDRQPGRKESRYAPLLSPTNTKPVTGAATAVPVVTDAMPTPTATPCVGPTLTELALEVAALRAEVAELQVTLREATSQGDPDLGDLRDLRDH